VWLNTLLFIKRQSPWCFFELELLRDTTQTGLFNDVNSSYSETETSGPRVFYATFFSHKEI
jgi:hypothetical protein